MKKKMLNSIILIFFLFAAQTVYAASITGGGDNSTEGLGSFVGDIEFYVYDNNNASMTVELTNTSSVDNGGFITAFAFSNPGGIISDMSLVDGTSFTGLDGNISARPYGDFDYGAALDGRNPSFLGGGSPRSGIGVGETVTFTFTVAGSDLFWLQEQSYLETNLFGTDEFFAARFRGFADGGSDKVLAKATATPEPSTFALLGIGIGFVFIGINRKKNDTKHVIKNQAR